MAEELRPRPGKPLIESPHTRWGAGRMGPLPTDAIPGSGRAVSTVGGGYHGTDGHGTDKPAPGACCASRSDKGKHLHIWSCRYTK